MSGTGEADGAEDGDERAFGDAGAVPGHDTHEDGDGSKIENGQGDKGQARGTGHGRGGTRFTGCHSYKLHPAEGIDGEGDGQEWSGAAQGKESPVVRVLGGRMSREEQDSAERDEGGDDGDFDHGEPEFEASVAVHAEGVHAEKKRGKGQDPDHRRYAREPELHISGGGNHLSANRDRDGEPVSCSGDESGPVIKVEAAIDARSEEHT